MPHGLQSSIWTPGRANSRPRAQRAAGSFRPLILVVSRIQLWRVAGLPGVVVTFGDLQRRIGSIDCQPR
jgi:hypothetical protein